VSRLLRIADVLLLVAQSVILLFVAGVLATFIGDYHVRLAHAPVGPAVLGAWLGGALVAVFFVLCAVVLALASRRPPGRRGRGLLIAAAVVQAFVFLIALGLLDWTARIGMLVALAVHLGVLLGPRSPVQRTRPHQNTAHA